MAANVPKLKAKISEKGCLSVYGIRRFPISFYRSEWDELIALVPQISKVLGKASNATLMDQRGEAERENKSEGNGSTVEYLAV